MGKEKLVYCLVWYISPCHSHLVRCRNPTIISNLCGLVLFEQYSAGNYEHRAKYTVSCFRILESRNISCSRVNYNVISSYAVTKPPVAQFANVCGRLEAFSVSIVFLIIGFVMQASSKNISIYAAALVFYVIGQVGVQFMQQLFAADTTSMANRALFQTLVLAPTLFTTWAASPIVNALAPNQWRWYVMKILGYSCRYFMLMLKILGVLECGLYLFLCVRHRCSSHYGGINARWHVNPKHNILYRRNFAPS